MMRACRRCLSRYVTNKGVRVAYYVDEAPSTKPPLFLLNGWAAGARDWGGLRKVFGKTRTVVTMDWRGIGGSDVPEDYSIKVMAEDAEMIRNEFDDMDIVGFSMGGLVAQKMAATKIPRKLVLASTNRGGKKTVDLVSTDFFDCFQHYKDGDEKANRRAVAAFFVNGLPNHWVSRNVDALKTMVNNFVDPSFPRPAKGLFGQRNALLNFSASDAMLSSIRCPTLVIHGDVDPVLHPQCASLLLHALPKASILLLAATGHHAFIQEPLEWANSILAFLDDDDDDNASSSEEASSLLRYDTVPISTDDSS